MCYNRFSGDRMQKGDIIKITIDNLDHQGRGIGRYQDKVVFTPNTLPGEVVKVKVDKLKKNIAEAHVESIIDVSEKRVSSCCPYFNKCGGCDLLHLTYDQQLDFKENKIKEIMHKFCHYDFQINPIIGSKLQYNYRNKVTFQFDNKVGFYERGTNHIIDVNNCKIINDKANIVLKLLNCCPFIRHIKSLMVRSNDASEILLDIQTDNNVEATEINNYFVNIADTIVINGMTTYGSGYIIENLNQYQFVISPKSFFQVNTKQSEKLYSAAIEMCDLKFGDILLDAYCGIGTIGICASRKIKQVYGIEEVKESIVDANENKIINNIKNIEFIHGKVEDEIFNLVNSGVNINAVILDPPRKGVKERVLHKIRDINCRKIVYISCDVSTLSRDAKILNSLGYKIDKIRGVDMFCQTYHVETIVRFTLRPSGF